MSISFERMNSWLREQNPEIELPEEGTSEYQRQKEEYGKGISREWEDLRYVVCELTEEEQDYYLSLPSDKEAKQWLSEHRAKNHKNTQE